MKRWSALLVLSLSVHLSLVWLVRAPALRQAPTAQATAFDFELLEAPSANVDDTPTTAHASVEPEATSPSSTRKRPLPRTTHALAAHATNDTSEDNAADSAVVTHNADNTSDANHAGTQMAEARAASGAPDLSARAAARTLLPVDSVPSAAAVAQDNLNAGLACAANSKPHLQRRGPPELVRGPDGSYLHEAPGFLAVIHRDGHVSFHQKPPAELHFATTFLTGNFDITDAMLRAMGEELYPAEKRWFLQQTQALREQLEADDRLHWFARARQDLLRRLQAIVDNPRLTTSQKRDEVFAVWRDCADDEVGARGRRVIEGFVHEHFTESAARAFSALKNAKQH